MGGDRGRTVKHMSSGFGEYKAISDSQIGVEVAAIATIVQEGRRVTDASSDKAIQLTRRADEIDYLRPPLGAVFIVAAGANSRISVLEKHPTDSTNVWIPAIVAGNGLILAASLRAHDVPTTGINDPTDSLLWEFGTATLSVIKFTPDQTSYTSSTDHRLHIGPGVIRNNLRIIPRHKLRARNGQLHPLSRQAS